MLRRLFRALPPSIRLPIDRLREARRLRRDRFDLGVLRPHRTFDGRHVAVAGVFGSGTGLGRAAELVALSLMDRGSQVTRVDLTAALSLPVPHPDPRCIVPAACRADDITDVVIVLNPDQPAWRVFDRDWLLGRTIVGHWIWEIEQFPAFWQGASDGFDEVWAGTELVLDAIRHSLPRFGRPLRLMPYAIEADPFSPVEPARRAAVRAREGLNEETFAVGYSFAASSNYYRKNPEDAVRAFQRAFPDQRMVRLLLRCHDLGTRPFERDALEQVIGGDDRIVICDAARRIGMSDFYALLDVYLSASRAEGYGLNLVEAAQCGLPVITGGWRLAPEILALPGVHTVGYALEPLHDPQGHYAGIAGATWSRPDVAEMAVLLRSLRLKAFGAVR
ncbi:MAG: glycosyltransferase [Xanthobacteraceae bacterium]|nr:glycosyltransferase [Xanthobacteraceae bacterium]